MCVIRVVLAVTAIFAGKQVTSRLNVPGNQEDRRSTQEIPSSYRRTIRNSSGRKGTKPRFKDYDTAAQLQLTRDIVPSMSEAYALYDNSASSWLCRRFSPNRELETKLERIQVLDSKEPLLLLSRHFMEQHGTVTLD